MAVKNAAVLSVLVILLYYVLICLICVKYRDSDRLMCQSVVYLVFLYQLAGRSISKEAEGIDHHKRFLADQYLQHHQESLVSLSQRVFEQQDLHLLGKCQKGARKAPACSKNRVTSKSFHLMQRIKRLFRQVNESEYSTTGGPLQDG